MDTRHLERMIKVETVLDTVRNHLRPAEIKWALADYLQFSPDSPERKAIVEQWYREELL